MKKILIVGGGSSGWMTAIYLNRYFNQNRRNFEITVLESDDIGILGVGEATVHSIRFFFAAMGLDERELIEETNATYKTGIMFKNWMKPENGQTHEYFHPFEPNDQTDRFDVSTHWMLSERFQVERYDEGVCASSHLIKSHLSPKSKNSRPYSGLVPYGYHLDAVLMARFLRRKATEAGVLHIVDTVTEVKTDKGSVTAVFTDSKKLEADLFIDCTGFKGLLIDQLRAENWESFEDVLPCNRAVAIQVGYTDKTDVKPYTLATALDYGWAWEIDLANRRGTGYVYDGSLLSKEDAERELRAHIGEASKGCTAKHLEMKIGCRKQFWIGNCIAVGLSGGFIEPLESTGLHIINIGAKLLSTHLSSSDLNDIVRSSYNKAMSGVYQDLKQFIVLHYCLTDRDDNAFWRKAQASVNGCAGLGEKLEVWRSKICEYLDLAGGYTTTFTDENYRYVLYGMGHLPSLGLDVDVAELECSRGAHDKRVALICQQAVPHRDLISEYRK